MHNLLLQVFQFIKEGGVVMFPLLIAILIALTLTVERFFTLLIFSRHIRLIDPVANQLALGNVAEVEAMLQDKTGPIPQLLRNGVDRIDDNQELLDIAIKRAFYEQASSIQRFLPTIQVLGAIMPMLGLLGTVHGMIQIFSVAATGGVGDPQVMASGISEALIATETGLAGAIPILFCHSQLTNMVDRLLGELKRSAVMLHHYSMLRKTHNLPTAP